MQTVTTEAGCALDHVQNVVHVYSRWFNSMSERWLGVSGTDVDAVELLTSDISDTNLNSTGRSGADRRGLQRSRDAVSPKVLLSRSSSDC